MADTPEASWTGDQWVVWLGTGFEWLAERGWFPLLEGVNGAGPEEEAREWAGECRAGFLEALGADEADIETNPLFDVLRKFLLYVDDDLGDDLARWDFLRDPSDRDAKILEYWAPWSAAISLTWVTAEQRKRLGLLGDDWDVWLPERLTSWWQEWLGVTPEELPTILDGFLLTLLGPGEDDGTPDPAPGPVDGGQLESLTWLTDSQQTALNSWTAIRGEEWHTWLPQQLSEWWPEWAQSTPGQLSPWLDECLLSMIIDLEWVRPDQAAELGADWASRLRVELDQVWPTWMKQKDPQVHQQWLTGWMPTLAGQQTTVGSLDSEAGAVAPEAAPEATGAPVSGTEAPVTGTEAPVTGTEAPVTGTEVPAGTGPAGALDPAEVTATVIEQIGLAGLRQLAEQVPMVTQLPPAELKELEHRFSQLMAEQLANASRQ